MPSKQKKISKRKQPSQAKRKQPANAKRRMTRKGGSMNPDLAGYAAVSLDPMADVVARLPDAADYHTVGFRSITEFTSTIEAGGYLNISFNPISPNQHYGATTSVNSFPGATTSASNYAGILANYASLRVVSAGIYVIPNVTLAQTPGISFCVNHPKGLAIPSVATMRQMQDAGPRSLAKGCFLRWKKNDLIDDAFLLSSHTQAGPLIFFRAEGLTDTSKIVVRLVVNYEAIVAPASQAFIRSTPSPKFPAQRDAIDNVVGSVPVDSTVTQMVTGGPTPAAAKQVGILTKIANGVGSAASSVLGKYNPISVVSSGLSGLFSAFGI